VVRWPAPRKLPPAERIGAALALAQQGVVGAVHWVTQADAIVTLSECGHPEVARLGYAAHQAFINHPVIEQSSASEASDTTSASRWLAADYWESEAPRRPLRASWLNGHTLKLPFSLFRLAKRLEGPLVQRGLDRAPWLIEELERQRG